VYQVASLPAPFPIRIPFAFLDKGKWGNIDTQNARLVISDFLEDFFIESFNLNIRFADIRNGRSSNKPIVPYFILVSARCVAVRCFCRVLYLNFRGCKIKITFKQLKRVAMILLKVDHQHSKNQKLKQMLS